jgi:multisubunit Na+/H+ antiporter MnhB subunit
VSLRPGVLLLSVALAAALVWAVLLAAPPPGRLAAQWQPALAQSGASHAVTAVLLAFRAYDTLLEVAVVLLAVLGATAAGGAAPVRAASLEPAGPVLQALVNALVPVMLLVAGYFLWAGTRQPGGAFQAAAVLAAAGVLASLAGRLAPLDPERPLVRAGLAAGLAVFLAASLSGAAHGLPWLGYPPAAAAAAILVIESALTLSIGLALVVLFASARR